MLYCSRLPKTGKVVYQHSVAMKLNEHWWSLLAKLLAASCHEYDVPSFLSDHGWHDTNRNYHIYVVSLKVAKTGTDGLWWCKTTESLAMELKLTLVKFVGKTVSSMPKWLCHPYLPWLSWLMWLIHVILLKVAKTGKVSIFVAQNYWESCYETSFTLVKFLWQNC